MAGTDIALDPVTHDFVDTPGGDDWEETSSLAPLCHYQLLDDFGMFFADLEAGSRLFQIPRKVTAALMHQREDAWREALGVFEALGLAEDVVIETDSDQLGRLVTTGSLTDKSNGTVDLTPLLTFGVGEGA